MRVSDSSHQHLTYCLNVHPGEDWDTNLAAIHTYALAVRDHVASDVPFGLGLRLSNAASEMLADPQRLSEFQRILEQNKLYVFTINGFPYGAFHEIEVKERVYSPDWRSEDRLNYTNRLANILAALLPAGVPGSISTVPGSYREWIQNDADMDAIVGNLACCAEHLAQLEAKTNRYIALALEPEPDCLFDTTAQTIAFFTGVLAEHRIMKSVKVDWRRYLGVCFDTCHLSVVFETPAESLRALLHAGIAVPKVQISAALKAETGGDTAACLSAFEDGTYLHQVRLRTSDGTPKHYPDLTRDAINAVAAEDHGEVRVHVHVPLYFEGAGPLRSTASDLSEPFFDVLRESQIPNLEIETYTFNVLPPPLSEMPIEASIIKEYQWVSERL